MAYYEITDTMSASHVSLPSDIHDPESDRLRLGRELARDFGHDSFSSNSSRGGANDNNNEEETDTLGSFDISRDARGTSTRRVDMLQHTPPTDSRLFSQEFADFTMAGRDDDDDEEITDSMEMGRGDNNNSGLRSVDFSSYIPFSIGAGSGKKQDRKMSSFFSTASPNPPARLQSISSTHSDPSEYLQASKRKNGAPTTNNKPKEKAKLGRESRGLGGLTGFDLSQLELSTPKNNSRGRTRLGTTGTGTGASKISDFVSNSGSGGSRSRFQGGQSRSPRDEHGDTASDAGSVSGRARPSNTRFTSSKPRQVSSSSVPGGGARGNRMTKDDDLTADVPTIVAKARKTGAGTDKAIPKSFKSTDAFLEELGLDGHTTTNDLKERLDKLKDVDAGRAPGLYKPSDETIGITQQSFLLPQMSDLSELISGHPGDATRFSRKRTSGGFSKTHKPLDSIPIPHDERAILMAMKLLQDKVEALEGSKAEAEQQCMHLEHELRRNETRLRQEQHRAKAAEDGLLRKRGGDSAFGGSNDGDAEERAKEKMKLEHQMEKLSALSLLALVKRILTYNDTELETTINSLHTQLDILTRELETSKIALRHMQEERNSAINSVAMAISTNEDLKAVNEELRLEIAHLRQGRSGNDLKDEEWKTREDRLRRKAREAREAAAIAEVFARETTRREKSKEAAANEESARAERREQRAREKEAEKARERLDVEEKKIAQEQRAKERLALQKERFDKMVEHQLRKLRPDLFTGESDIPAALPLAVNRVSVPEPVRPRTQAQRKGKKDTRSNEAHGYHATSDNEDAQGTQTTSKDNEPKELSNGDDTVMSISPDEIKRIAKEINAERRKRKVVAANAAQEPAPSTQKPKHQAKKAAKPKTSMKKPTKASAPSTEKTEEITAPVSPKLDTSNKPAKTVRIAKTDKGKGKAVDNSAQVTATLPAQPQVQPQASTVAVSSDAAVQASQTYRRPKRRRVVKKVVYYYDEETTMSFPVEEEVEEEVSESEDEETETLNGQARQQLPEPEHEEHTSHEEMSYEDPMTLQESMILPEAPPVAAASPQAVAAQPAPREQEHDAQSLVDHLAEHDPESCTVCKRIQKLRQKEQEQRMANPLADIDNSMAFPAPALQPVSTRRLENTGSYEEEATPRPSQEPKTQLSKVVRQLQDEFAHIKLTYQNKAEEFMSLDPSMGKRRRKALTGEMNELVAEMDYKCDQIYALYDVNEEFDGRMDSEDDDEDEEGEEEGEEEGDEEEDDADLTEWTIPESSVLEHEGGDEDTEGSVDEEER
ncbi:hypothetical protein L873DRAFT_1791036 [Choiromyces venosus 120613-1]|uniref:Cep57 centrosome microtubule-binding domain-containing protein n=1 Tax=Choiromyces venosus 120613-1 TaxID=1336337 RepID=A0A3N4JGH2_9PEZI|nr:hypothetical protein L873DRAFT_1791036 [Choiromyces venosus 120613-1]